MFRGRPPVPFAFRAELARSGRLEDAARAALKTDPAADVAALVGEVLDGEVLV